MYTIPLCYAQIKIINRENRFNRYDEGFIVRKGYCIIGFLKINPYDTR